MTDRVSRAFLEESSRYLRDTYLPRLRTALSTLPAGDLAWSPHPKAISFETILRHLEGNVRQWILSGLGGLPDARDRASEFEVHGDVEAAGRADTPERREALIGRLAETIEKAAAFLEALDPKHLVDPYDIQGFETTGLGAILHVVEHFSWHTGQAVWIAKARAGEGHGISFYDESAINRAHNAPAEGRG